MNLPNINLPNALTILRLVLVPIVVVMIAEGRWMAAFVLFVTAGVTDAVDGFIARRFDLRTELGAYLDPLADKALLISIYVTLAIEGVLPGWLAVVVVSRDVMIIGAVILSWLLDNPVEIRPALVSKLNTLVQIGFAALKLGILAFGIGPHPIVAALPYAVAGLTLASMATYLAVWFRHMGDF
jgi:cardiolipin synthase